MVLGLEGKADSNGDGIVSFMELEQYVQKGVREWSTRKNKQQKPYTKIHGEKTGDLALSFTPDKNKPSLTEKPIPVSRADILFRSTFLPGWGQYYAGDKMKGGIYGATAITLTGYLAYNLQSLAQAQNAYSNTPVYPGTDLFFPTYVQLQSAKSELVTQEKATILSVGLLGGFWLWNIIDAGAITNIPKQDFFSFDMGVRPIGVGSATYVGSNQNNREEFGNFQFHFKF